MVYFIYAYHADVNPTFAFVGLNITFVLKNIESSVRRTAIIAFDYRIAEKPISATYLALLVSIVNLTIVVSDAIYPMLLDYVDLSILVSFGSVYNVVFLITVWGILTAYQKKDSQW